jgi:hypothetical protein
MTLLAVALMLGAVAAWRPVAQASSSALAAETARQRVVSSAMGATAAPLGAWDRAAQANRPAARWRAHPRAAHRGPSWHRGISRRSGRWTAAGSVPPVLAGIFPLLRPFATRDERMKNRGTRVLALANSPCATPPRAPPARS